MGKTAREVMSGGADLHVVNPFGKSACLTTPISLWPSITGAGIGSPVCGANATTYASSESYRMPLSRFTGMQTAKLLPPTIMT